MNAPASRKKFEFQTNLCIQLHEFDLNAPDGGYAIGTAVAPSHMYGHTVAVRMMNEQECLSSFRQGKSEKDNAKFFKTQPTIQKMANGFKVGRNDIPPMQVGGLMMFNGCTLDREQSSDAMPVWKSQYVENYGNDIDRAVLYGSGRVQTREHNGKTYAHLDLLHIQDAQQVKTLDDIAQFYAQHMTGDATELFPLMEQKINTESIGALRLIAEGQDGKTTAAIAKQFYVPSVSVQSRDKDGNEFTMRVPGNALDAMEHAFIEGGQGDGFFRLVAAALDPSRIPNLTQSDQKIAHEMSAKLQSGAFKLEMIPGVRIDIVGDSLDRLLDEDTKLHRNMQRGMVKPAAVEGQPARAPFPGFIRMTVALAVGSRRSVDQAPSVIVNKFACDEFAKAYSLGHIPTEMTKTPWAELCEREAEQYAEQAAARGGTPESEPDLLQEPQEQQTYQAEDNYSPSP